VVSPTLSKLHQIGLVAGMVFLICSLLYDRRRYARFKLFTATNIFVLLMLALTAISQFRVTPRMRELRPEISAVPSARAEFDRLHVWSTRLEGGVLLLGLVVVVLTGKRWGE
jgi:hypothetical protein